MICADFYIVLIAIVSVICEIGIIDFFCKIRLSDAVSVYLPGFENWASEDGKEKKTIRVADLLTHTSKANVAKLEQLQSMGVETLLCKESDAHIDVVDMLQKLGALKIDSIILEGGGTLNNSFVEAKAIDEVYSFIAPKIIGGANAKSPVEGNGVECMSDALELQNVTVERCGNWHSCIHAGAGTWWWNGFGACGGRRWRCSGWVHRSQYGPGKTDSR